MATATAPLTDAEQLKRWPAYAWAFNIPDLHAIFNDPAINDSGELQARIQKTDWWKQNSPAVRANIARQATDPTGWQQDIQQKDADIWDLYNSVGLKPSGDDVENLAKQALTLGWTNTQLKDAVVGHMNYSPDVMQQIGSVQSNAQQLKQQASQYYVGLDDQTAFTWGKQIAAGESTAADYQQWMVNQAKSKYAYSPEVTSALDKGITTDQFFSPYKQEAAKLLETTPEQIDMNNSPQWSAVTQYADPQSGQHRLMTISEMQTYVRGMDQWGHTNQAKDQAATLGQAVLKSWGKVA